MKIKYSFILFLVSTVALVSSCQKDKLTPIPTTVISDQVAFASADRINGQVSGIYSALRNGQFYGGRYVVYNEIRGEDFINELTNGVTGLEVWNHTLNNNSNPVTGLWAQAYYVINLSNVFLEGMASQGSAVVGATLSNNYTAEARFLRAVSYYSLLQLYARPYADGNGSKPGLPLRLTGNVGSGNYDLARSTVAQIYEQVLTDLNYAETNLPLTYSSAALRTTRAHRNTAIAFKTRVYLSMQKYAEVITEANKIVSPTAPFTATTGVPHALEADYTNLFKSPYTSNESIFSLPHNANEVPGTQNQLAYYFSKAVGNGEYSLNSAGIISNASWSATDRRRSLISVTGGKSYTNKYSAPTPYTDWVPVIRYAEVLLNLAEAKARTSGALDPQAIALLNAVRMRSDPTTIFTAANLVNSAGLINAILTERRIEFLGEGIRNFDLMRLLQTIPGKTSTSQNVPAVAPTANNYIWPISAQELVLNKLAVDN